MHKVKAIKNVAARYRCSYSGYGVSHRSFSAKIRQKIIQQRVQRFRQLVLARQKRTKENAKRRRLNKGTQAPDLSGKIFIPVATGYDFYQRNNTNQRKNNQQGNNNPKYQLAKSGEKRQNRTKQQTRKGERCIRLGSTNGDSAQITDICRVVSSNLVGSTERYSKKHRDDDESRTERKTANNFSHPAPSQPSIRAPVVIPNEFQTPRTNRSQEVKSQPVTRQKTMSPSKHGFHPRSFSPTYKMLIETKEALQEMVEYEVYQWRKLHRTAHGSKENEILRRYASSVRSRHHREVEKLCSSLGPIPSHSSLPTHTPAPVINLLVDEDYYGIGPLYHSDDQVTSYRSTTLSPYRRRIRGPAVSPDSIEMDLNTCGTRAPSATPIRKSSFQRKINRLLSVSANTEGSSDRETRIPKKKDGKESNEFPEGDILLDENNSPSKPSDENDNDDLDFISPYELEILSHIRDSISPSRLYSETSAKSSSLSSNSDQSEAELSENKNGNKVIVKLPVEHQEEVPQGKRGKSAPAKVSREGRGTESAQRAKRELPSRAKTEINPSLISYYTIHTDRSPPSHQKTHPTLLPKISPKRSDKKKNKSQDRSDKGLLDDLENMLCIHGVFNYQGGSHSSGQKFQNNKLPLLLNK